jgi:hypothetical protein
MKKLLLPLFAAVFSVNFFIAQAQTWSAINKGFNNNVNVLSIYNSFLYSGGLYDSIAGQGANKICRLAGDSGWLSLGSGVEKVGVWAITGFNDQLTVAGFFTKTGGSSANNIAQWDGTKWSTLGKGTNGVIYTMAVYNGELYAGGGFDSAGDKAASFIARWNGTAWNTVGCGVNYFVQSMFVENGSLYIGGAFDSAGGKPANGIAKWNGISWSAVGMGVNGFVSSIAEYNGNLYVGGNFTIAGGKPAHNIAQWNGMFWSAVGSGTNNTVECLAVFNGALYAGGDFTSAGGISANYVALWNGSFWSVLGSGMNSIVLCMTSFNNELYIGGAFTVAGNLSSLHIAEWGPYPTAVNNITNVGDINVYPNPNYGKFNITVQNISQPSHVEIYNILGKMVYKIALNKGGVAVDMGIQPEGIYFYKILSDDDNPLSSGRLVIK